METKLPRLSRFSSFVKNVMKSPHIAKKDDESSKSETTEEPRMRYENTYRIEPAVKTSTTVLNTLMNTSILEMISGEAENFLQTEGRGFICTKLSEDIKQRVKAEYLNSRFRIVVHVSVIQNNATASMGSRCLWNEGTDSYTTVTVPFGDSVIIATCYMLYLE